MPQAKGTFEVKRSMAPALDAGDGQQITQMHFDKTFHGPLAGTGVVHMLAASTPVDGSAAYVAVERIAAVLDGKSGSFLTTHRGVMDRGEASLQVDVVPDSGSGALGGLRGRMQIDIIDGQHHYSFDYTLPGNG